MRKLTAAELPELYDRLVRISERCLLDKDKIDAIKAAAGVVELHAKLDTAPPTDGGSTIVEEKDLQKILKKVKSLPNVHHS
jgi:hypothetical protein